MKIIVDAMSGDFAPLEIVKGSAEAVKELGVDILLVGDENKIKEVIKNENLSEEHLEIHHCEKVITMEDDPTSIVRANRDSSMGTALTLLKEGKGDAVVSAGNTGALLAGGTLIVKRIPGVTRAALAPIFPTNGGKTMIVDAGANTECRPEMLEQFAVMGSAYMENAEGIKNPRVGLANNGTEETKGTETVVAAHSLLKERKDINFIGNVEGRGLMLGECDVFVADGFAGNLILKGCEGFGVLIMKKLKDLFTSGFLSKIAALLVMKNIKKLKKSLDYKEVGGAVLLGLQKPVIKAHGNSDARGFKSAVRQAVNFAKGDAISVIEKALSKEEESK